MKPIVNPHTTLLALGVVQPATSNEVFGFLGTAFSEAGGPSLENEIKKFLNEQVRIGRVLRFRWQGHSLYSLTVHGHKYLPSDYRKLRDKLRAYLLKDAHKRRKRLSRVGIEKGLAGDSPAVDTSTSLKGSAANKLGRRSASGLRRPTGQVYWPRIARQFQTQTGPSVSARDSLPPLISYVTKSQVARASLASLKNTRLDVVGLAVCIGFSPKLISQMANNSQRNYRTFQLPKKGGGTRKIESPRVFLKVVQWFLAENILSKLGVDEAVHSFRSNRSIVSNAIAHENRAFVAGIDIKDFFGSVTKSQIVSMLQKNNFCEGEADLIADLATNDDHLPQGAPTSPVLSNAMLFDFDRTMVRFCKKGNLEFTRYADDITISGDDRSKIMIAIQFAGEKLRELGFDLNPEKTRVASRGGRQRVTGIVVNIVAAPPKEKRRKIRAIFHQAGVAPDRFRERIMELGGYIGYMAQFPKYAHSAELKDYRAVLDVVRNGQRVRG